MKKNLGFTLIELMIVVAIIGILVSIAMPAYGKYVTKSKRSDAKAALMKAQLAEEQWRSNHTAYTGDLSDLGITATGGTYYSEGGFYTLSVVGTPDSSSYLIQASAVMADAECSDPFAINESGKYYAAGYSPSTCW